MNLYWQANEDMTEDDWIVLADAAEPDRRAVSADAPDRFLARNLCTEMLYAVLNHEGCQDGKVGFILEALDPTCGRTLDQFKAHLLHLTHRHRQHDEAGEHFVRRIGIVQPKPLPDEHPEHYWHRDDEGGPT